MKKLFLIAILISTSIMCSCQTEDVFEEIQISQDSLQGTDKIGLKIEKYMNQNSPGVSVQGAASYGDYLFQFENYNANVYVYNLKTKEFVEKVPLTRTNKNHCNNVSFSNIFYDEGDEFPLLYVSGSQDGTYNKVQVYRIFNNENIFSFEKIQDITLPEGNDANHMFWTQTMIDNEENYMYVLSKSLHNDDTYISKFIIPSINADVNFIDDDIIEQFEVTNSIHKQGAVIHKGFLYIMYGVPAWGDTNYLRIIDLANKEDYITVNISAMGFNQEFEGLTIYKDMLIAPTNSNAGIFSITIYKK